MPATTARMAVTYRDASGAVLANAARPAGSGRQTAETLPPIVRIPAERARCALIAGHLNVRHRFGDPLLSLSRASAGASAP